MTERTARRQTRQGIALIVLGVFTILIAVYFQREDAEQRECVASQIEAVGEVLTIRGGLVEDESQATRAVIRGALSANSPAEVAEARDTYFAALEEIDRGRANTNKVPDFPPGTCD